MALRAFHANPSIGGFGNENVTTPLFLGNPRTNDTSNKGTDLVEESGDALCQIAKELVDNAVDACETARRRVDNTKVYRVKVEILPYHNGDSHDIPGNSECGTMQIIVSDNGCGMKDIQACVNAFQTTKTKDTDTAGRYGIGLTLCLLHAQRLVPGTYSCITSATRDAKNFKRALYFVDTVRDAVECHREEQVAKSVTDESGTCVSVLIPVSLDPLMQYELTSGNYPC